MKKQIYNPYLPEWEGERTFEIYVDGELMEEHWRLYEAQKKVMKSP